MFYPHPTALATMEADWPASDFVIDVAVSGTFTDTAWTLTPVTPAGQRHAGGDAVASYTVRKSDFSAHVARAAAVGVTIASHRPLPLPPRSQVAGAALRCAPLTDVAPM